jgi:hypothetical protein
MLVKMSVEEDGQGMVAILPSTSKNTANESR